MGSVRAARLEGMKDETSATVITNSGTRIQSHGSLVVWGKSRLSSTSHGREAAHDPDKELP